MGFGGFSLAERHFPQSFWILHQSRGQSAVESRLSIEQISTKLDNIKTKKHSLAETYA